MSKESKRKEAIIAIADRDWWRRIGKMFRSKLIGFSWRIEASFGPPLGECSGVVARKVIELDDCARQLRSALADLREWHRNEYQSNQTIDKAADDALETASKVLDDLPKISASADKT